VDSIILNKTDLIGEEALNDVKENLNKLNPQAPIIITTYSQFNDYLVLSYHYNVIVLLITELLKDYRLLF
jgi:G3E family GTPase